LKENGRFKGVLENTSDLIKEWGSKFVGVITSGIALPVRQRSIRGSSYLKVGMVHPIPEKLIEEFAKEVIPFML
jgi:indolepyruvate ferredoxin oxidoreductase alpha subunit